jgi:hypothetical protein
MLVRLLYASRARGVDADAIDAILAQCRAKNPAQGVTGILCHGGDIFMQVVEGGREAINRLYGEILRDPRHEQVTLLHYEEIAERRFAGWTMGLVNLERINPSTVLKFSEKPALDPFSVSGRASMALLEELIATASIIGRAG